MNNIMNNITNIYTENDNNKKNLSLSLPLIFEKEKEKEKEYNKGNNNDYKYVRKNDVIEKKFDEDNILNILKIFYDIINEKLSSHEINKFCLKYILLVDLFIRYYCIIIDKNNTSDLFYYMIYNLLNPTQTGGTITYNKELYKNGKFPGNEYVKDTQDNIIIVGGGPTGLYMAILLKKINPQLKVVILERRIDTENLRSLTRSNTISLKTNLNLGFSKYTPSLSENITKANVDFFINGLKLFITDSKLNLIDSKLNLIFFDEDLKENNSIQIKELEYKFANYAQELGVLIVHTVKSYKEFVTDETKVIFDATGGHMENISYNFYVDISQTIGDGINLNPLNFFKSVPIVSIGDSLYRGNYKTGYGLLTSFTICFFISYYFNEPGEIRGGKRSKTKRKRSKTKRRVK